MFSIRLWKIRISFHFSFFAVISIMLLLDGEGCLLLGFYACLLHEMGHLAAMLWLNVPLSEICFYGAGVKIVPKKSKLSGYGKELAVLAAGPLANIIVFAAAYFLIGGQAAVFGAVSLVTGLFNLLPLKGFDGGRMLSLAAERFAAPLGLWETKTALAGINIAALAVLLAIAAARGFGNPSLYITVIYFMIAELMI